MRTPEEFLTKLFSQVWETPRKRQHMLIGKELVKVSLSPPKRSSEITQNFAVFRQWVTSWREFENQLPNHSLSWSSKRCHPHGQLEYPVAVSLTPQQCVKVLSAEVEQEYQAFNQNFELLVAGFGAQDAQSLLRAVLLLQDAYVPNATLFKSLNKLLPQIEEGVGKGQYVRSICFHGIHTKFLEKHSSVVRTLYGAIANLAFPTHELFLSYLDAIPTPYPNITVHAFDPAIRKQLLGLELMALSTPQILSLSIKADTIVVVENSESAYAFSGMPNALIFAGGGKDTTFLQAEFIQSASHIVYWGDIDTHGFICLAAARRYCPTLQSILMTREVFDTYEADFGVVEDSSISTNLEAYLTQDEQDCYAYLVSKEGNTRLEQQFVPLDIVHREILRVLN